jgi:serine phosphatase RsbU (regulator of sigma subunit)
MHFRKQAADYSDIAEVALIKPGDILFLYTDGVYDGTDEEQRHEIEELMRAQCQGSAQDICSAMLAYAVRIDDRLRDAGEEDRIDDKTVVIVKRGELG